MHKIYPWQQQQWQNIVKRKSQKKLPHSILLSGQQGLGKLDFALTLAELLLCEDAGEDACGLCRNCKLINAGNHPDFFLMQPEDGSKVIKVDQIRAVVNAVATSSHQGKQQIVIVEPADAMNIAANNALLKTLEEPTGEVVFLLVTAQASLLPATIRSRCQNIVFHAPKTSVAVDWLQQQGIDSSTQGRKAAYLVKLSDSAPLQALKLAQENAQEHYVKIFKGFLQLMRQQIDAIEFAKLCVPMEIAALQYIQLIIVDLLRLKTGLDHDFLLHNNAAEKLKNLSDSMTTAGLFACYDKITELFKKSSNNLNQQLLFEDLGICLEQLTC